MTLGRRLFLSTVMAGTALPARAAEPDVVIVGAGVAGLAAAKSLMAANKSVLVVEARERIGGRAVTDSTTFGFPFDLGAQWIEAGRTNPAMAILREMNAKPVPDRQEQAIYVGGTEAPKEEYARFEKIAIDASRKLVEALKKAPDVPVGRVLVAQDPLEKLAYAMVGPLESGVELGELSARDFMRQPETEPQYSVAEGLGALVARWGAKVPVKLGTRVVRIDSTGSQVLVVTTNGQLTAKAVIVTVPTGVLATGQFGFAPQLSAARREAIAQLPMALYNKVALSFGRKVIDAPAGRSVIGLTRKDQPFDAIVRPYNRDAAIVFVGGDAGAAARGGGHGGGPGLCPVGAGRDLRQRTARPAGALVGHALGQGSVRARLVVDGHAGQRRQAAGAGPAAPRSRVLRRRGDRSGVGDARRRRLCLGRARGARGAGGAGGGGRKR